MVGGQAMEEGDMWAAASGFKVIVPEDKGVSFLG